MQPAVPPSARHSQSAADLEDALQMAWREARRYGASGLALYLRGEADTWRRRLSVAEGDHLPEFWSGPARRPPRGTHIARGAPRAQAPLWIPLLDQATVYGWLAVCAPEHAPVMEAVPRRRIGRAARWLGLVVRQQRLAAHLAHARAEADLLQRVAHLIHTTSDMDTTLVAIADAIAVAGNYRHVEILRLMGHVLVGQSLHDTSPSPSSPAPSLRQGIAGRAARTGQTQFVPDVRVDPDFLALSDDIVAEIAVPLQHAGRILGVLNVESDASSPLDESDVHLLEAVAAQIDIVLENGRLTSESQQRLASLESLWAMSADSNARLNLPALLESTLQRAAAAAAAPSGAVFLVDTRSDEVVLTAGYHWPVEPGLRLALGEGVAGRVVQTRAPLITTGVTIDAPRLARPDAEVGALLGVPILWGEIPMGALVLAHHEAGRTFDRTTVQIVAVFAVQAASAIHATRLYEAEQRKSRQLEAIHQINRQIAMSLDRHTLLTQVVSLVRSHLHYPTVCLYMIQDDRAMPVAGDTSRTPVLLGQGVVGWVAQMGQSLLMPDGEPTPTLVSAGTLPTTRSQLAVPITLGREVVGVLDVQSQTSRDFDEVDEMALGAVASQTAVALANAEHYQDATQRAEELSALYAAAQSMVVDLSLEDRMQVIAAKARDLTGAMSAQVSLLLPNNERVVAAYAGDGASLAVGVRQPAGTGLIGVALSEGRPLLVNNAQRDPRLGPLGRVFGVTALIVVPLQIKGHFIGVLSVAHGEPSHAFTQRDLRVMRVFAQQAALAIHNAQLYEETAEARRRAETILNEAQAGLVVVDADWCVQALNAAATAILGNPAREALGRPVAEILQDSRAEALLARVDDETGNEARRMVEIQLEGRGRDVLMGIAPLKPGYLISLLDVTALKEVDRLKSEIVANFSHELRAPLASIKAYTEILLHFHGRQEELPLQFLTIIDQETDRLTELVNDVLDLSRLEAGRPHMESRAIRLRGIIDEVVELVQVQAVERGIDIHVVEMADAPPVWGDRQLLIMIVRNLLVNAIKYNKPGGSITILVDEARRDVETRLRLRVQDTGVGIPAQAMPRLFEKFYRVASTTESGIQGTGLGLVLVKAAVEAQGGEIYVTSEEGRGSEFSVLLPLAPLSQSGKGPVGGWPT